MYIGGLHKFSLINYPGKIACVVFSQGCNFRCGYCHNPELVDLISNSLVEQDIIEFLKNRQGKLDAVVISGGEPTLQKTLPDFIRKIKALGFLVKLDTNGTNPSMLEFLIKEGLIDYVAMDIKAPLLKYEVITNSKINTDSIKKSMEIVQTSGIDHEFRTTVVKEQLSVQDIQKIAQKTKGSKHYFQKFEVSKHVDESFSLKCSYTDEEFESIKQMLQDQGCICEIR